MKSVDPEDGVSGDAGTGDTGGAGTKDGDWDSVPGESKAGVRVAW